jgi:hypothetical protein
MYKMDKKKPKMSAALESISSIYAEAKNTAKTFIGEKVPEGKYEMRLTGIKFHEKEKDGETKVSLLRTFTVLSGENEGMSQSDFMNISHPVGLSYAIQFIAMMGYGIPESIAEWPEIIEELQNDSPATISEIVHNGNFADIYVMELLEEEEDEDEEELENEAPPEDEEEDDADSEEEADEDESDETDEDEEDDEDSDDDEPEMTLKEAREIVKKEKLGIRLTTKMSSDTVAALIENARKRADEPDEEEEEEDEETRAPGSKKKKKAKLTTADLISFAEQIGIDDLDPDLDLDEMKEELCEYEIDEDDVSEDELAFITTHKLKAMLSGE